MESRESAKRPWLFLAVTIVYTWTLVALAASTGRSWLEWPAVLIGGVGLLGPAVVASMLVSRGFADESLGAFWRRALDPRRVSAGWWAAIALVAAAPPLVSRFIVGEPGVTSGELILGFIGVSVLAGVVEEPGWRGYALDGLLARHGMLSAALAVGVVWSVWHLPLFFVEGTYQHGLGVGTMEFWLYLLVIPVQSFVYASIYIGTGGRTSAVVVFHILMNVAGEVFSAPGAQLVESGVWLAVAVAMTLGRLQHRRVSL